MCLSMLFGTLKDIRKNVMKSTIGDINRGIKIVTIILYDRFALQTKQFHIKIKISNTLLKKNFKIFTFKHFMKNFKDTSEDKLLGSNFLYV